MQEQRPSRRDSVPLAGAVVVSTSSNLASKYLVPQIPRMSFARVFVISDQELFRFGVVNCISSNKRLTVVGEAARITDASEAIKEATPDVMIRDLYNVESGHDFLSKPDQTHFEAAKTVVFTAASTDFELVQCVHTGVTGILNRNVGPVELLHAIHEVHEGRVYYCSETTDRLANNVRNTTLTKRELEILQYLAMGLSNKEIAKRLKIRVGTVKTHLINIISKLDVTSRTGAVIRGVQLRLVQI